MVIVKVIAGWSFQKLKRKYPFERLDSTEREGEMLWRG
jgi:hypothetical protein